jgi:hypothetical protein
LVIWHFDRHTNVHYHHNLMAFWQYSSYNVWVFCIIVVKQKSQIVIYKWILFAYLEFIRSLWKKLDAAESGRNFLCLSKSKSVWPFYLAQQLLHLCVALSVCRSGLPDLKLVQFTKLEKKSNDHTKYQIFVSPCLCVDQGCQILLGSIYQIGEKNQMTAQYT